MSYKIIRRYCHFITRIMGHGFEMNLQHGSESASLARGTGIIQSDRSEEARTNEAALQTEQMLSVFLCPLVREDLAGKSYASRLFGCIDRWQEIGRPHPSMSLAGTPVEEWLPEFEKFLDSYGMSGL
jgi:hypothetical protein